MLLDTETKELLAKYSSENSTPTTADFWKIVSQVAKDPEYFKHYFSSAKAFSKYLEISQKGPQINENQFFSITSDFLSTPLNNSALSWKGEIQIYLGEQDPLIDPIKESILWKKVFPQALIHILPNKGHFPHLEELLS
ncbi:MAG: alpha/beta hydrolase [Bdellovibrionales bacterium]|nr:alpha/beta hydrolase [Bdellovibrionales bacterium]